MTEDITVDNGRETGRRSLLQSLGALGALLASGGVVSGAPGRTPDGEREELLVGVSDGTAVSDVEQEVHTAVQARTTVTHRNDSLGYFAVDLPEQASEQAREAVRRSLERRPGVEYVEPNVTYETQLAPNDPTFDSQYAPQLVNAPVAWETTTGSEDVTVAVVDQGTQYDHPDLAARFGNDRGTDLVDGDSDPGPDAAEESHGTHVSGCAAASTDDGTGTAGVSDSRLLSVRAVDETGRGSASDVADGIQYAADQGADVLNLSLGGGSSSTVQSAVRYATERDVCLVAAAGNSGGAVEYPAAYDECVAVSAIDPDESLAAFSCRGPNVDVASPGVNVLSTVPYDEYGQLSGTSMAAPVAAGVAALGLAADPTLSASALRERLEATAVDVGLSTDRQGSGRVDAAAIVDPDGSGGDGDGSEGDGGDGEDESDGDQCGSSMTASVDDDLYYFDSDRYTWSVYYHDQPCEVTIELDGGTEDFGLYATTDGRDASHEDYDKRSTGNGPVETITIENPEYGGFIGIYVNSTWAAGEYTLSITETGAATASTQTVDGDDRLQEDGNASNPGRGRGGRGAGSRGD